MSASGPAQPSSSSTPAEPVIGLVDIHCHLLPGVDDGCREVHESVECGRRLAAAGFTHAICTPHVQPDLPHNNVATTPTAVAELQMELDKAGVPLKLLPGGENRLSLETTQTPFDDLVLLNMGNSRGGRFFLFDTWDVEWPDHLDQTLRWLAHHRITPIMAHPERCTFVCEDPLDAADRLAEMGVLLQLNCYLLAGPQAEKKGLYSKAMRHCAERLIEFDHYSFIATDCHRADGVDERLEGLERARDHLGSETFTRLAHRNPMELLPGSA